MGLSIPFSLNVITHVVIASSIPPSPIPSYRCPWSVRRDSALNPGLRVESVLSRRVVALPDKPTALKQRVPLGCWCLGRSASASRVSTVLGFKMWGT